MTGKVRRWTSPNDANHKNHHAEVDGVEFFRFPYSPFMGRVGRFTATVSDRTLGGVYHSTVFKPNPNKSGATIPIEHKSGTDQDSLFVWAAAQMKRLNRLEKGD